MTCDAVAPSPIPGLGPGLRQPAPALGPRGRVGADHHPPAQPPQVPRDAAGRRCGSCWRRSARTSGGSGSSSGCCWPSGRCSSSWSSRRWPSRSWRASATVIAGRRTHRVLVLDGSLSMGYTTGDETRFDQAKALAAQLVKDARRGDAISLVADGRPAPGRHRRPVAQPRRGPQGDRASSSLPHGGTDLAASFEAIDRVLDVSTIPQKEVVFLTDLQAASWRRPAARATTALEARCWPSSRRRQAAVGRHRPGPVRRREPRGDRPAARRAGRHRRSTASSVRARGPQLRAVAGRRRAASG